MKRWCIAAMLLICVTSCGHRDDRTALPFVDTFDRPNTTLGLGEGWDARAAYETSFPLPTATDGYISGGSYTYSGASVIYAVRHFRGIVRRMGTEGRWRHTGSSAETTVAMAITANDRLVTDMVHLAVTRARWDLTVRRDGGAFEPVASGRFSPALEFGRQYQFDLEASDSAVTVRVPGKEVTTKANVEDLIGDRAFWEEYPNERPAGSVFDFDAVWADE